MAPASVYWRNMLVVNEHRHVEGCVVECGVWRGGMSAGMAEVLGPSRRYFLFDSFEGLPEPSAEDGQAAREWQMDKTSPTYYDNCAAPIDFARRAMAMSGVPHYELVKGWFNETLPKFVPPEPIAVLRLDGDWYDSTLVALENLAPHMAKGGVIILDDYYAWDGCSRAVHDYLSQHKLAWRITVRHGIHMLDTRS